MAQIIVFFILSLPLYAALIWSFLDPRESLLFGKRWMYKEEPDISDGAIIYTKIASIAGIVLLTLVFLIAIISELR
ncbi:hypothetical protein [Paenibacillus glycinis]|uniref:Selenocysteine lyase n=1 Tax=Paenibacillus glycinis TaxID=2697035 RepID=A0ABW9Y1T6_9BACL|nr:hypothetical protein [Paenibacillus glycinis]NBD28347.1 hypothetical protein [Paenibacillus glycinis]